MYRRLIAIAVVLGIVLTSFATVRPVHAQDFNGLVRAALGANELLVSQIDDALAASDLATLRGRTQTALGTSEQVEALLVEALRIAPDDPARSRVEGVLVHIQAATAALRLALEETTLDAARGRLDQARGEAEEALAELAPFAQELPAPAQELPAPAQELPAPLVEQAPAALPRAGGLGGHLIAPTVIFAVVLAVAGFTLRRYRLVGV